MPATTSRGLVAIVDDDDSMRRSLERLLQANEFSTAAFANAEDFLDSASGDSAIALVLDIHLGGMSGIELRRHLLATQPTLPVIFITAYDHEATRAQALALGCIDYLQKPFDVDRLMRALERGRRD